MKIERAQGHDAKSLTALTIRSKAHWKYTVEQIEKWRKDLAITEDYIRDNQVIMLRVGEQIVGYYSILKLSDQIAKLDNLFIEPSHIGRGFGTILVDDCIRLVKELGFEKLELDSDPHTQTFYEKLGFVTVGKLKSSVKDRFLPIMELAITSKT